MKVKACAVVMVTLMLCSLSMLSAVGAVTVESVREENAGSFVAYPVVLGIEDPAVQQHINQEIFEKSEIAAHLQTLAGIGTGSVGLEVSSRTRIFEGANGLSVLSVLVTAEGRMPGGRPGSSALAMLFDLTNGEEIPPSALFTHPEEASERLADRMFSEVLGEISDYADDADLAPVPMDNACLDEGGITFYYPAERFTFLSGRSGAVNFRFHQMEDLLDLGPHALLPALGLAGSPLSPQEAADRIHAACQAGRLPGIPAAIGDELSECARLYGQTLDSEYFPGGARYQMESAEFRKTGLISSEEGLLVEGILSERLDLYGIATGKTGAEELWAILGEPLSSLPLQGAAAELYGLPEGFLQSYAIGGNSLSFLTDEAQIVRAIWLMAEAP